MTSKHPVTIATMYQRLADTMDALLEQKITPAHGHAIADAAEKMAAFARIECQYLDIVNSRGTGFMPEYDEEPSSERSLSQRARALNSRR